MIYLHRTPPAQAAKGWLSWLSWWSSTSSTGGAKRNAQELHHLIRIRRWRLKKRVLTLRSLDELTELGKQVSDLVDSSLVHSDGDGAESTESELPEVLGQSSGLRRSRSVVTREPSARTEAQDSPEVID